MAKNDELMEEAVNKHLSVIVESDVGSQESAEAIDALTKLAKIQNDTIAQRNTEVARIVETVSRKKELLWHNALAIAGVVVSVGGLALDFWATHEGFKLENDGVYKNQTLKRYLPGAHGRKVK